MSLLRVNSLCANPAEELTELVRKNDCEGIRKLVEDNAALDLLNAENAVNKTILQSACHDYADQVNGSTIKLLLSLGANPLHCNEEWQFKNALHFAALGQNPDILEVVIKSLPGNEINAKANGRTALHVLVKECVTWEPTLTQCVRLLIENGMDARAGDGSNNTALYWAAKKKCEDVVNQLLSYDARVTEKEATALRKLSRVPHYMLIDDATTNSSRSAFALLRAGDENAFIQHLKSQQEDKEDVESESYLQYACKVPHLKAVAYLIGQDPNRVGRVDKTPPIEIAVKYGRYQIVDALLQRKDVRIPPNLLCDSLTRLDFGKSPDSDFVRTFNSLVHHEAVDVNTPDAFGYSPLYYAARYGGPQIVQQLLDRRASLANRDAANTLAVSYIDHDTLRDHFDDCIEAHPEDKLSKESMYITFNYTTLLPAATAQLLKFSNRKDTNDRGDCEGQILDKPERTFTKECDVVLHMSRDADQKALLQHPLVVSFLNVKWHRVRMIFYANLLIYSLFCCSLLAFILKSYNTPGKSSVDFWHLLLFAFAIIVCIREVFQMLLMTRDYFCNADNYIEVLLLANVFALLFWPSASDATKRQLFAFAVLLAAIEMLFLLGSIPELSTYVIMLRTVSFTFFKFLLFNGILILAFAFCFYTLFRSIPNAEEATPAGDQADDGFFSSIYASVFKTLVMLTGEFEAGELDFNQYPITSHIIFIMFVLLIAIILLNLLNGLAVSDTQEIKNEAKLVALTARAQYIGHIESLVFADRFWSHLDWRPDCCSYEPSAVRLKKGLSHGLMARVSISSVFLNESNELKVHPRQDGRIEIPCRKGVPEEGCGRRRRCKATIDSGTIKKAMQIVYARNATSTSNEILNMLKTLQASLQKLEEKVDNLQKEHI